MPLCRLCTQEGDVERVQHRGNDARCATLRNLHWCATYAIADLFSVMFVPRLWCFAGGFADIALSRRAQAGFSEGGCSTAQCCVPCLLACAVSLDWATLKARRDAYVSRLNGIYASNLEKSGVTLIRGEGKFTGPKTVTVGDEAITVSVLAYCTVLWCRDWIDPALLRGFHEMTAVSVVVAPFLASCVQLRCHPAYPYLMCVG